ncbi:uncharacterized protein FOMMEDRAFT_146771 [Fomitiporia mediterranea MF3/22]|uniref:uncharacterized protein n=1 Tax=Fomitiporia mediterranea (strain MF3/22) TaxID=694068 RepID=UPI0004409426|nr:uncharacterized protein FOMMEDRAFT_146771 [Fomitiporia mediterranea MF3/22]EJD03063.1 hypothetical protein FOMMEDRAFT_146771 [Fomitiporia mediterranea MF3/22]
MIPRCFALAAVALSSIHFAEALPVSSRESQSLAELPTSVDVGLPTSLPIPTVPIPTDAPITSLLPLPTLTDTAVPVSQPSVPISDPLDGTLGSVKSISGADLPLNQDPEDNPGDSPGITDLVGGLLQQITDLLSSLLAGSGSDKPVDIHSHTEDGVDLGGLGGLGGHNGGNLNL